MFDPSYAYKQSNVLITGASNGIGLATAELFLTKGMTVHGIDVKEASLENTRRYHHHQVDIRSTELPDIPDIGVIIHCAGVQESGEDIDINLNGTINIMKKYALDNHSLLSVVTMASVSAHNSAEFSEYVASKGGVLAYTRWLAKELAPRQIPVNSISFGGVRTDLNSCILDNPDLYQKVMAETPMRKWATAEECADWIYFLAVVNKSMTAQDLIIDNGEFFNHTFVWE